MSLPTWYIALLVFVGLQRLGELFLSRRNQKWLLSHGGQRAREPLFPLMVLVHTGIFVGIFLEVSLFARPFHPLLGGVSIALFLLAQLLRVWVLVALRRSWNVQIVVSPDLPVVDTGPYAYIRHPNYLAVIIEIAVLPLIHSAYVTAFLASLLNALVLKERIRREEEELFRVPGYRERMGHKPRLLPGLL